MSPHLLQCQGATKEQLVIWELCEGVKCSAKTLRLPLKGNQIQNLDQKHREIVLFISATFKISSKAALNSFSSGQKANSTVSERKSALRN
jgi:hypothetical protein